MVVHVTPFCFKTIADCTCISRWGHSLIRLGLMDRAEVKNRKIWPGGEFCAIGV